jgi:uncharacterized membrane protein YoaK (UPF0700 family)
MKLNHEAQIHYTVAFIGGFLGIFPVVNAAHFLGSAQTSNLIDIVLGLLNGSEKRVLFHALGAFLYGFAVFLVTFLPKHSKANVKILAMFVDIAAGIAMWLFPIGNKLPLTVYLYPTFFSMAFQWCAFKGAYDFSSSTIFSSNNFRQFISALTEIYFNGDKSFSLKAKFYGITLLCFHLGIVLSWFCWCFLGNACFLLVVLPCSAVICYGKKTDSF